MSMRSARVCKAFKTGSRMVSFPPKKTPTQEWAFGFQQGCH